MPGAGSGSHGFLILHGWGGSGPGHWQHWLARQLRQAGANVRFPSLPEPDEPRLDRWLAALHAELLALPARRTVVAHSLAVLLWLHHVQDPGAITADRLLLVAPPGPSVNNPQVETFFPPPLDPAALKRSTHEMLMVCSDADPFCPERAADCYAAPLDIPVHRLPPEARHINVAAGYGVWPWVLDWCEDVAAGVT